jgi:hypothetical protein
VVADAGQQDGRPQRLGDVVGGPQREAVLLVLVVDPGGDEDHRDVAGRLVGLQALDDFVAVHLRHHHVEQDQVGAGLGGGDLQRDGAGFGGEHPEVPLQHAADALQVDPRVVHHQDGGQRFAGGGRVVRGRYHVRLRLPGLPGAGNS